MAKLKIKTNLAAKQQVTRLLKEAKDELDALNPLMHALELVGNTRLAAKLFGISDQVKIKLGEINTVVIHESEPT